MSLKIENYGVFYSAGLIFRMQKQILTRKKNCYNDYQNSCMLIGLQQLSVREQTIKRTGDVTYSVCAFSTKNKASFPPPPSHLPFYYKKQIDGSFLWCVLLYTINDIVKCSKPNWKGKWFHCQVFIFWQIFKHFNSEKRVIWILPCQPWDCKTWTFYGVGRRWDGKFS